MSGLMVIGKLVINTGTAQNFWHGCIMTGELTNKGVAVQKRVKYGFAIKPEGETALFKAELLGLLGSP